MASKCGGERERKNIQDNTEQVTPSESDQARIAIQRFTEPRNGQREREREREKC